MPKILWSLVTLVLLISAAPAYAVTPWVHTDWQQRVPFSADPALIEGSETFDDFAMLVTLDGARHPQVFADAKADGSDLLFASANGATVLDREIVTYDAVGEFAEIWVRVPGLSKLANGFYLYFDNPLANLDPHPAGSWGEAYRAVYHFDQDPAGLSLLDSSQAGSNITLGAGHGWSSGDVTPGVIGQAWRLNGSTHHLATSSISTADSSYTIEAWLTHDIGDTDFFFQANPGFWHVSSLVPSRQKVDYAAYGGGFVSWFPVINAPTVTPAHYMWQFDAVADTIYFYYDGVRQNPSTVYQLDPMYTGRLINPTNSDPVGVVGPMFYVTEDFHAGLADEFRLREGRPSAERILTEVRSASDPVAFLEFGDIELVGATAVDVTTRLWMRNSPNPSVGPTTIRFSLPSDAHVRLRVYDLAGRRVATLVDGMQPAGPLTTHWSGRSDEGDRVAAGVYLLRLETPFGSRTNKVTMVR